MVNENKEEKRFFEEEKNLKEKNKNGWAHDGDIYLNSTLIHLFRFCQQNKQLLYLNQESL
jgi:hypothetical protein